MRFDFTDKLSVKYEINLTDYYGLQVLEIFVYRIPGKLCAGTTVRTIKDNKILWSKADDILNYEVINFCNKIVKNIAFV